MHSCPACEREFKSILDFPRMVIQKVEKIEIPDHGHSPPKSMFPLIVGRDSLSGNYTYNQQLPEKALQAFQAGKSHIVYAWSCYTARGGEPPYKLGPATDVEVRKDLTAELREKSSSKKIANTLSFLEDIAGKELSTTTLAEGMALDYINGAYLGEKERVDGETRVATLRFGYGTIYHDHSWEAWQDIARVWYKGRLSA